MSNLIEKTVHSTSQHFGNNDISSKNELLSRNSDDKAFKFNIDFVDDSIESIHKHTVSSYTQITATFFQAIAFVLAYCGIKGCEFYVFDASPGGSGKDSAFDKSFELVLQPIMDIQNQKKRKYDYERQKSNQKDFPKSFHFIHTSDATEQGVLKGFETTPAQFIAIGETSKKMRKSDDPLMNFITREYGKKTIIKPNYKKDLEDCSGDLTIKDTKLFFYGNSNLELLGSNKFTHHLKGGLLNRCLLVFNTNNRAFKDIPDSYELPTQIVSEMHKIIKELIEFVNEQREDKTLHIPKTEEYINFNRIIYDITQDNKGTELEYLYKRIMQNINAFITTLHYIKCFQNNKMAHIVDDSTVSLGVDLMKYFLQGYHALIDEIIGVTAEKRDEDIVEKIHVAITTLSDSQGTLQLLHRDIYRAVHLKRKEYDFYLSNMNYKMDKKYLYVLPNQL